MPPTLVVEVTRLASQLVRCSVALKVFKVFPAVKVRGASVGSKLVVCEESVVVIPVKTIEVRFARQDAYRVEITLYSTPLEEHWLV